VMDSRHRGARAARRDQGLDSTLVSHIAEDQPGGEDAAEERPGEDPPPGEGSRDRARPVLSSEKAGQRFRTHVVIAP
jgi:hypothetical protein